MTTTISTDDLKRRMHGAVEALRHDLGGLRTGRASVALVEPVHVEVYGSNMPLNQVATVSTPEKGFGLSRNRCSGEGPDVGPGRCRTVSIRNGRLASFGARGSPGGDSSSWLAYKLFSGK